MIRALVATILVLAASAALGAPPPDDMVKSLSDTIRKKCPEAKIEVTKEAFVAKHDTMMFTLHSTAKTGEISPQTYQQEGPNFKGFILRVALEDGQYGGAAEVPQTLQGPYFPTFIDAPATDDGKKHYQVHFSYGNRLDPELKKAIFDVIPKTRFQQQGGVDAGKPRASAAAASHGAVVKEGHVVSVNGTNVNWPDSEKLKWIDAKDPKSVDPRVVALGHAHLPPPIAATHGLRVYQYVAIGDYLLLRGGLDPTCPDGGHCWVVNTKDMTYVGHFLDKNSR